MPDGRSDPVPRRPRSRSPALVAGFLLTGALAGCAGTSAPPIDSPEAYLLPTPAVRTFAWERPLENEGWIRGRVTIDIGTVTGPGTGEEEDASYAMAGTVHARTRGHITDREDAFDAPRAALVAAMDPADVPVVFEDHETAPGVRLTRIHRDRLGTLALPIDFEDEFPASPFSSALHHAAWRDPLELALVWHKILAPVLSLPPFGTYRVTSAEADGPFLVIRYRQDVGGDRPIRAIARLERDRGLVAWEVERPGEMPVRLVEVRPEGAGREEVDPSKRSGEE